MAHILIFLTVSFKEQDTFKGKFQFFNFSPVICAFCVLPKNFCLTQGHKNFLFSSRNFIVLALTIRSEIHLELFIRFKV